MCHGTSARQTQDFVACLCRDTRHAMKYAFREVLSMPQNRTSCHVRQRAAPKGKGLRIRLSALGHARMTCTEQGEGPYTWNAGRVQLKTCSRSVTRDFLVDDVIVVYEQFTVSPIDLCTRVKMTNTLKTTTWWSYPDKLCPYQ